MATEKEQQGKQIQTTQAQPARALSPFEEMDRFFESFMPRAWLRPLRWDMPSWGELAAPFEGKMPRVDIVDRDEELLIRAELPGVDKRDVDVSMTDNTVTIKATTKRESKEEKGNYYRREISSGSFARTLALPCDVNGDNARASFKDGVLELTVPKVQKSKRRTITVD